MGVFDPYNLNSIYNQTPIVQRPMVPNPPTVNTMSMQQRDLDSVNGIESAKQFIMPPKSRVALFDMNEDVFYIKQTDASGFPTLRKFRFFEESETPMQAAQEEPPKYVTLDEFNKLREEIKDGQQSIWDAIDSATRPDSKSAKSKKNGADV